MASSDQGTIPVVIDHGTFQLKAGFTGEKAPRAIVESVVGKLKTWCMSEDLIAKCNIKDTYVGEEAQAKRGVLLLKYPIERGIITDWDSMEKLWAYTFTEELKVEPKGAKVVLSQTPCNPYQNKKKTAEIFFERFQSAEVCLANQAVLALYASGQVNGVIVDSGHGVTCAVPIHQGKPLPPVQMDLAGRDLDEATYKHLCKKGYAGRISDIQIYKEKMCYVTLEPDNVSQTGPPVDSSDWNTYELRGIEMHIDPLERHRIPEALFKPSLIGLDYAGIHEMAYSALSGLMDDVRKDLLGSVYVVGGSTLFPGFEERLQRELTELAPPFERVNVAAPTERKHSVWIGGAIFASGNHDESHWISKQDYEEIGPEIVHRKYL